MKIHATTNIIQFQQAADASMQYRQVLNKAIYVVFEHRANAQPTLRKSQGMTVHVIFSSDHGLCGSFNERIYVYVKKRIDEDENPLLLVVGEQGRKRLEMEYTLEETFFVPQTVDGITAAVQHLLSNLDELRSTRKVRNIKLHYNKSIGKSGFREQTDQLFPLDLKTITKEEAKWEENSMPSYFMSGEKLLSDLLKQYFFITLYRTFCDSLVAENEARIASMTSAKKNIEERIEELETNYKRVRQDSITDEIRDISSGFRRFRKSK